MLILIKSVVTLPSLDTLNVRARVQASVFPTGPKGHCDQTLQSNLPGSHLYSLPAVILKALDEVICFKITFLYSCTRNPTINYHGTADSPGPASCNIYLLYSKYYLQVVYSHNISSLSSY
jgi:hypothetical protein